MRYPAGIKHAHAHARSTFDRKLASVCYTAALIKPATLVSHYFFSGSVPNTLVASTSNMMMDKN